MNSEDSRELVLAVRDERLRRQLAALLGDHDVRVTVRPDLDDADPTDIDADVVVLRADRLDGDALPDVLRSSSDRDAPGVVVLGGRGEVDEVGLVAAGASAVLDTTEPADALADQLVRLVEAEVEGGLHGPESGGSIAEPKLADFQSRSLRMRDFLNVVRRVAATDSTLLVLGETGVGKERLVRAIHAESARAEGPFVTVNCGALPEALLESELFGHEKGAFTGATDAREGHFEAAEGGTLLLDEIGELPRHLQVKLLTALQRREIQPLGAEAPKRVDVRVIAATNRDLESEVTAGRFREDLFYRLNVVSLVIPPLRERLEDLPQFLGRFLRHFAEVHHREGVKGVERRALRALARYDWPGNVRELVNVVERAVLLCEGSAIGFDDLPPAIRDAVSPSSTERGGTAGDGTPAAEDALYALPLDEARRRTTDAFERRYLEHHLAETGGRVGEVARIARINPRTLYEKMKRLDLRKEDYR